MIDKKIRKMECPECKGVVRADATKCVHCSSSFELKTDDKHDTGIYFGSFIISFFIVGAFGDMFGRSISKAFSKDFSLYFQLFLWAVLTMSMIYFYFKKIKKRHDDRFVYLDDEEN